MILNIQVPIEKVQGSGWHKFKTESFDLKVSFINRMRASKTVDRYYYNAIILFKDMPTEFKELCKQDDLYIRNSDSLGDFYQDYINRKINNKFKPPKDGWVNNILEVQK